MSAVKIPDIIQKYVNTDLWWQYIGFVIALYFSVFAISWNIIEPLGIHIEATLHISESKELNNRILNLALLTSTFGSIALILISTAVRIWPTFTLNQRQLELAETKEKLATTEEKLATTEEKLATTEEKLATTEETINTLGIIEISESARATMHSSIKEKSSFYKFLGTSANNIINNSELEQCFADSHRQHDFFIIDPRNSFGIKNQSVNQGIQSSELMKHINKTITNISELKENGCQINLTTHFITPTFRIIETEKAVYVSIYEDKKSGPEAKQLTLSRQGLLGTWFIRYFNNTKLDSSFHGDIVDSIINLINTSRDQFHQPDIRQSLYKISQLPISTPIQTTQEVKN